MNTFEIIGSSVKAIAQGIAKRKVTFLPSRVNGGYAGGLNGNVGFMSDLVNRGVTGLDYDLDALCPDVLENSVVAACVNAIAQALPEAPILLEKRIGANDYERIDAHPVLDLLHNPNPYLSEAELWGATTSFERTRGEAFWYFEYDSSGRVPREIWFRAPQFVQVMSDEQRFISGYKITAESGTQVDMDECDVVHFRHQLSPYNLRAGWSPIQTGKRQIVGDNGAATYHSAILRNAGAASLIISLKDAAAAGEVTPGQLDEYVQLFKRKVSGEGSGAILGMDLPLDIHKVGFSPDELALEKLLEYYESRICALMGVNRRVINLGQDPTYENSKVALNDFWERTIIPMRRRHASTLSSQLLPLFGLDPAMYRLNFDFSEVEALSENVDAMHARWRETLTAGGIDLFTFQDKIGLKPDETLKGRFMKVSSPISEESDGESGEGDEVKARVWVESNYERASDGRFGSVAGNHGGRGSSAPAVSGSGADSGGSSDRGVGSPRKEPKKRVEDTSVDPDLIANIAQGTLTPTKLKDAYASRKEIVRVHDEAEGKLAPLKKQEKELSERLSNLNKQPYHPDRYKPGSELADVIKKQGEVGDQIKEIRLTAALDIFNVLAVDNPSSLDWAIEGKMDDVKKPHIETGVALLGKIIDSKSGLVIPEVKFHDAGEDRSNYVYGHGINMGEMHKPKTVVHEMGHHIEMNNPAILKKCIEYREERVEKAKRKYGSEVVFEQLPVPPYEKGEMAHKGVFRGLETDYPAKVYPNNRTTEILTMGLQLMVQDPVRFAKADPDFFHFIFNITRG